MTAGPTHEPINPVRFLGNCSSGKMGFALADEAARARGARVFLVAGPVALPTPAGVERTDVETAAEMAAAVRELAPAADLVVMAAAVADYGAGPGPAAAKLKKEQGVPRLELAATPDILAELPRWSRVVTVGFAAEDRRPRGGTKPATPRGGTSVTDDRLQMQLSQATEETYRDEWLLGDDEPAIRAAETAPAPARLLPSGDAYFLLDGGERELLVPRADQRQRLWTSRVWPGALLVEGEIRGTWRRAQHIVRIETWARLSRGAREAVEAEASSLPLPGLDRAIEVVWNP